MTGIYNTRFIYYNEEGKILAIRPYPPSDNTSHLEVDFSLVEEFLFGTKSYSNYKINYFLNLVNGIVNEEEIETVEEQQFLYNIPLTSSNNNEITLVHNPTYWSLIIREDVLDKIKLFQKLEFFICKKDDPTFFYSTLAIDLNNISPIKFTIEQEKNLRLISVLTYKKFKSYGIKEIHE
jgi:hypothetical protein